MGVIEKNVILTVEVRVDEVVVLFLPLAIFAAEGRHDTRGVSAACRQ